jgi:hypothetical protein
VHIESVKKADIHDSTIKGNEAGVGPGARGKGGGLSVKDVIEELKITLNSVLENQAGVGENTEGHGGGIHNLGWETSGFFNNAVISLHNVTISGNSTQDIGGGVSNEAPESNSPWPSARINMDHVTLAHNVAITGSVIYNDSAVTLHEGFTPTAGIEIKNSLLAGHQGIPECILGHHAFIESGGYNLGSGSTCQLTGEHDLQDVDARLWPLRDNGGPTWTQALRAGSPAIDHIPAGINGCTPGVSWDQRGALRASGLDNGGDACDGVQVSVVADVLRQDAVMRADANG